MTPYYSDDAVTIYHGDVVEILPILPPAELTLTDPPYNVGLDYSDGDNRADYGDWIALWFALCAQPLVVTPGHVNLALWLTMAKPRWICAWFKSNQNSPSALNGFSVWEPVLVYGKHPKPVGQDAWLVPIKIQPEAEGHPCPKFLPFWQILMEAFSEPGDLVVDPFMGSGTTLRAAKNLGRIAIGIEIEEAYCEMAALRCSQEVLFA